MSRPRKNGPRYRCEACRAEFDDPILSTVPVTTYRTRHEEAWVDLAGELDAATLRSLCESPKSQLSIRSLDWVRFVDALSTDIGQRGVRLFNSVSGQLSGGFTERITRVRLGQPAFRADLLTRYGTRCAFSGHAPSEVLDAAHLYSYAAIGEHHDEGGLLLRRDLHRLFDLGKLAVRPDSRIAVHNSLKPYPLYARCEGAELQVAITERQKEWFTEHRRQWGVDD